LSAALDLAVAGLVGLVVGIEREWSGHATGPGARFAGVRTFLLLGILGGAAGLLQSRGFPALAAALVVGGAALAVGAYLTVSRRGGESVDGTTEAAALAVLGVSALAGLGYAPLAAGCAAVMVLALGEKLAIHAFVRRIGEVEMRAALQFAALALVLLPLLPEGPYGPWGGVRPRELWIVVLIVSGLNFAGYLARRAVGAAQGMTVTGLLGGLISSTAVSLAFARQSRERDGGGPGLALGVMGACTVLVPRLLVLTLILNPALTGAVAPGLLPIFLIGVAAVAIGFGRTWKQRERAASPESRSPLRLVAAIGLALLFQAVLMLVAYVHQRFGRTGVLTTAGLLGLTDMDALTLAMSRLGTQAELLHLAAQAILMGVLTNTLLKLGVVVVVGRGDFRRYAGLGLLALGLAAGIGLWST
jgi:uncharacterized membrane protein (DUF4010 family)